MPSPLLRWATPSARRSGGCSAFLVSEVALFSTLIVDVPVLPRQGRRRPDAPRSSLPLVIGTTSCLLASSVTIHRPKATGASAAGTSFCVWWAATIGLGIVFLLGTAYEWRELIVEHHLTISRNLFGTTYYTLVGFHGLHVTAAWSRC